MLRTIGIACLVLLAAVGVSSPQTVGQLGLFSDVDGINCMLTDAYGVVDVHVVLLNVVDAAAVQFTAPKPSCWPDAIWIGDNMVYPVAIGDTQTDIHGLQVAFGACLTSHVYLGKIVFFSQGNAQSCCFYPLSKAIDDLTPEIPTPLITVCAGEDDEGHSVFDLLGVSPSHAIINGGPECNCMGTVLVEGRSWGAIKAIFD